MSFHAIAYIRNTNKPTIHSSIFTIDTPLSYLQQKEQVLLVSALSRDQELGNVTHQNRRKTLGELWFLHFF
jgi:hypothetical protein